MLVYDDGRGPVGLIAYHVFDLIYRPRPHCRITALTVRADGDARASHARSWRQSRQSLAGARCVRIELTTRPDRDTPWLYERAGSRIGRSRLVKSL